MRFRIILATAAALASVHAGTAAAQTDFDLPTNAASTVAPLPASLVPDADERAAESTSRISVRRVLVSTGVGMLAGAGTGLMLGAMTSHGCREGEEWCILTREEEIAIAGVAGAMAGAGIGALYGLFSGPRRASAEPAPVSITPAANGGLTVGLTLRH